MVSSIDSQIDILVYYNIDPLTGYPISIKTSSRPFSIDKVKLYASYRGSLRNVARYGRIIRRAILDEATKKFII